MSLPSADAVDSFEATGLPVFAQEEDAAGAYVLTGSDRDGLRRLTAAGLSHQVLDPDMAGATYYFTMLPPGRPEPDWSAFGVVLYHNGYRLIRSIPADAERLAAQGVEPRSFPWSLSPLNGHSHPNPRARQRSPRIGQRKNHIGCGCLSYQRAVSSRSPRTHWCRG